jgi:hypothetical protein
LEEILVTRYIICQEGKENVPGQFLLDGSMNWGEDKIWVSWNFNHQDPKIGYASDIRREEDGWITAEIELFEQYQSLIDVAGFTVFITKVEDHWWKDIRWASKGTIASVAMLDHDFWPKQLPT